MRAMLREMALLSYELSEIDALTDVTARVETAMMKASRAFRRGRNSEQPPRVNAGGIELIKIGLGDAMAHMSFRNCLASAIFF